MFGDKLRIDKTLNSLRPPLEQHGLLFARAQFELCHCDSFSCDCQALAIDSCPRADGIDLSLQCRVDQHELTLQRCNARGQLRLTSGRMLTPRDAHQYLASTYGFAVLNRQLLYAARARRSHL